MLLVFPNDLLGLVQIVFGVLRLLSQPFVGRSEFAVFCGQFLSSSSLRIPTAKKITRCFVPRSLVCSD